MNGYANPNVLVSSQWLAEHLDDPTIRIVEITWGNSALFGRPAYNMAHAPGAVAWDFGQELNNPDKNDLLDVDQMERLLSKSGITLNTTIVLYSGLNNLLATFAFWALKVYGHLDVRLLDGDREKWLAENRPITDAQPEFASTIYRVKTPDQKLRANCEEVLQAMGTDGILLVDARSAEMYRGEDKAGVLRAGHIPGARNLAAVREVDAAGQFHAWRVPTVHQDGTFKTAEDLRGLFHSLGITPDQEIITYCFRGGLSTHAWFVLTQLLGYPNVSEYDRSWAEWGNRTDTPVETEIEKASFRSADQR